MAWHQQVMGVCRLQKCEIEEANEANTLVWTRQTLVHGYTYDKIYHIVDTTDRCLLHTSFFGAVIFLRWWLNINHRTRPTCSHSNDFERVVSKSQVLYVWMECIINTWLHPTIAKSLPGRMCIQSLTPVWKSDVYLNQLVDVHFKNDDQLGFWSDECSHFNV